MKQYALLFVTGDTCKSETKLKVKRILRSNNYIWWKKIRRMKWWVAQWCNLRELECHLHEGGWKYLILLSFPWPWAGRLEVSSDISSYLYIPTKQKGTEVSTRYFFLSLLRRCTTTLAHQFTLFSFPFFYILHSLFLILFPCPSSSLCSNLHSSFDCFFFYFHLYCLHLLFRSMDREGGSNGGSCYYSVLGIRRDASFSDIRTAYRKLAMVK